MFSNLLKYYTSVLLVFLVAITTLGFPKNGKIHEEERIFQKKDTGNIAFRLVKYQLNYQISDSVINDDDNFEYFSNNIISFLLKTKFNNFYGNRFSSFFSQVIYTKTLSLYDLFCEWRSDC